MQLIFYKIIKLNCQCSRHKSKGCIREQGQYDIYHLFTQTHYVGVTSIVQIIGSFNLILYMVEIYLGIKNVKKSYNNTCNVSNIYLQSSACAF